MGRRGRRSRRGAVVPRGKTRNSRESLSSPRRASLRTAVRDPTVKESLSSLFVLPRAGAAGVAATARPPVAAAAPERRGWSCLPFPPESLAELAFTFESVGAASARGPRDGAEALAAGVLVCQQRFRRRPKPELVMVDDGESLTILDTRDREEQIALTGWSGSRSCSPTRALLARSCWPSWRRSIPRRRSRGRSRGSCDGAWSSRSTAESAGWCSSRRSRIWQGMRRSRAATWIAGSGGRAMLRPSRARRDDPRGRSLWSSADDARRIKSAVAAVDRGRSGTIGPGGACRPRATGGES